MSRLISHRITKAQHSQDVQIQLRPDLHPPSPVVDGLIQELRQAMTKGNPAAARFTQPAGMKPLLQQRLLQYLQSQNDQNFVDFSHAASQLLVEQLKKELLTTGGYLVFAQHDYGQDDFIIILLLSTRARSSYDAGMNLISALTLDVEHLRHGGRIRTSEVTENADGVIHFVSRSSEGLFFREFLGCELITDSAAQGNLLHSALNKWALQEELNDDGRDQLMRGTYSYWDECRKTGSPITLTALANILYPAEPEKLLTFLSAEDLRLAGEFPAPPPRVMRKFIKFAFNGSGLKIEFDRNSWLGNIAVAGNVVTIKQAPHQLIEQITEAKHGGG